MRSLVPVFLKITLPDGVRTVGAVCNIALALSGLLFSLLVLMMPGIAALALVLKFLQ